MCDYGDEKAIFVIRANNDHSEDGWHVRFVDACIAEYVQEMNRRGIITVGCCCGHGKSQANVLIAVESAQELMRLGYSFEPYAKRTDVVIHYIASRVETGQVE